MPKRIRWIKQRALWQRSIIYWRNVMAKKLLIPAIFIFLVAVAAFSFKKTPGRCTLEARICLDGTSVGRTGPNCEFAPCPPAQAGTTPSLKDQIPENWNTYTSAFTISYPPELTLQELRAGQINLSMQGPTQVEGTELFDGISITITPGAREESSLLEFVEDQWATRKSDPIYLYVTDINEVTIAGLSGYEFTESSLREFRIIYLPFGNSEYLQISILVEDPGLSGFSDKAESILSTIKVTKPDPIAP